MRKIVWLCRPPEASSPGISQRHPGSREVCDVSRDHLEIRLECGCGEQGVDGGHWASGRKLAPAPRYRCIDDNHSIEKITLDDANPLGKTICRGRVGSALH